jgi:hypothetical protein
MTQDERETLDLLKFELKFLEDGGYGRSPRTPWRAPRIFEDSPSCLNFDDPSRPHPCSDCALMQFVPEPCRDESIPCRFIPLGTHGEDVDYFYRCGTQPELEEALAGWLRKQVSLLEEQREAPPEAEHSSGMDPLRRQQWIALAGNLYLLGNLHCEIHDYAVAYALYSRALAAAEKVASLEDNGRSLVARIQRNQQAVSEILNGGESRMELEQLHDALDDKIAANERAARTQIREGLSW